MPSNVLRAALAAGVLACAGTASAGFVDIGGGWAAQWDASLDPYVSVDALGVEGDAVFVRKNAEFIQGPKEPGGFPSIAIVFRQIAWPAVSNIVIEEEVITNSTGTDWTGYRMQLIDHGDAFFDPDATMNSGGPGPIGFDIQPFTTAEFQEDDTRLLIGGGVVPDGDVWRPGSGNDGGQLWITVNPHPEDPFTIFTLKETPLPTPGALALMAFGAAFRARRRRVPSARLGCPARGFSAQRGQVVQTAAPSHSRVP
jgi:MYXO-CTERM domain-containing protein